MSPTSLFDEGKLTEAIRETEGEVKKSPLDANKRWRLAELLCFIGEFERADQTLDALAKVSPSHGVGAAQFRQTIRAAHSREQVFHQGRAPDFIGEPTAALKLHLEALLLLREGREGEAAAAMEKADADRPRFGGVANGASFQDFRDQDDAFASFLEVLSSTGQYFWIPFEQIEKIEFVPPEFPRDLLWRRAKLSVRNGPSGDIHVPAIYVGTVQQSDDLHRLGRATDWTGGDGVPARGLGQRMFWADAAEFSILELSELSFNGAGE